MAQEPISPDKVREAAVAGRFYPADPEELRNLVKDLLAEVSPPEQPAPKAIIAPHAGYLYSGPIAAVAHAQLAPARDVIRRIVLLGPSHYVAFEGLAASSAEAFATPLGNVALDLEANQQVRALPRVRELDEAHAREHALEVQLPFLQTVLGEFAIVPLVVGDAAPEDIAAVLDALWAGPETRFVISSDLSHYQDLQTAHRLDSATARAIETMKPADLAEERACGRLPIQGLLQSARHHGLAARTLDLRTSGDTAGPRDQVVGYGAFAFHEPSLIVPGQIQKA